MRLPSTPLLWLLLPAILLLLQAELPAQQEAAPHLESFLEPEKGLTVGDPLQWTIQVTVPKGWQVQFPAWRKEIGDFSVLSRQPAPPIETAQGTWKHAVVLRLAAYRTGKMELPAQKIPAIDPAGKPRELSTSPVSVEVGSVLKSEEKAEDLRDLKKQASLEESYLWLWWGIPAAFLLALLVWYAGRRWRNRKQAIAMEKTIPLAPAHIEALQALEALLAGPLTSRDLMFYFPLSEIIRRAIGRQFRLLTLERTTAEIMEDLRLTSHDPLSLEKLEAFLSWCDLIKFARHEPAREEQSHLLTAARELIDHCRQAWETEQRAAREAALIASKPSSLSSGSTPGAE